MSDRAKHERVERFTMLEARGPNNPLPGSEAWPIIPVVVSEGFTMLEPRGPNRAEAPAEGMDEPDQSEMTLPQETSQMLPNSTKPEKKAG